jgi:hypothetical protein
MFNNISVISIAVNFIGGRHRSTWRKPLTCRKSMINIYRIMLYRVHLAEHFSGDRNWLHTIITTTSSFVPSKFCSIHTLALRKKWGPSQETLFYKHVNCRIRMWRCNHIKVWLLWNTPKTPYWLWHCVLGALISYMYCG